MSTGAATEWSAAEQAALLMERNVRAQRWAIPLRTNDPDDNDELHNVIVLPRVATLRLFDARTLGRVPVTDALVRKITIKTEDQEHTLGVFPDDERFINDWYPLITTPEYVPNPPSNGHAFDRRRRREWVQHLRVWLRMLGRYGGSITGWPPLTLSGELGEAVVNFWASATGLAASEYQAHEGYRDVAAQLTDAARGVYRTNADGELRIPLPVSVACEVMVHMRELALVDAQDYPTDGRTRRLEYVDDAWHCIPAGKQRESKHKLAETLTFKVEKDENDHVTQAFAHVWSQPVYLDHASGDNAEDKRRQIVPAPIGRAPTMFIPTVTTGSGPKYGQVGFVRSYGSDQSYAAIRQHGNTYYAIVSWSSSPISTHASKSEAQAASDISASPPTTYRQLGGQWSVVQVNSYYGPFESVTRAKRAKYHAGHDLAGLSENSKVFALKGGRVRWIKDSTSGAGGRQLGVESHADGIVFEHQYVHMHTIDVKQGQIVQAGQVLGTMGRTGNIDNNGSTPSTFPTHCHFALKRRAANGSERPQQTCGTLPGATGYFAHKPNSQAGPLAELAGVSLSSENKACVPDDTLPHLLPCGGEPNANAQFSTGAYYRWKPARCSLVPVSIRDAGGTEQERTIIKNACWARDGGICPWDDLAPGTQSRYYRFAFNGEELRMIATSATGEQTAQTWRAYSGRAVKGSEVRREPGPVFDTVYYAKRFELTRSKQKEESEGPIPEGVYLIDTDAVIDFDTLPAYKRLLKYRTDNWGQYGVRLIPLAMSETFGRSGFYIHGGTSWGSAGCIDLRTQDSDFFQNYLKPDPDGATVFEVTVDYRGKSYVEATDEYADTDWEL
ncbi:MAG: M23 family metallopeptidase [Planctomycetota bacterium]|nr:MAG: M23 family metallopeptidase [Planctomycetota bacterium]